LTPNKLRRNIQ